MQLRKTQVPPNTYIPICILKRRWVEIQPLHRQFKRITSRVVPRYIHIQSTPFAVLYIDLRNNQSVSYSICRNIRRIVSRDLPDRARKNLALGINDGGTTAADIFG